MFQKYYDTNIMTTFVKNLVGSTYIPNIPVWKPDTVIIKNGYYISRNYILKAINSYTPTDYGGGPRTDLDGNYFNIVDKYVDNTLNHGYCTKYNSPNSYYDPKTHYYLGQYLRMQRDMYNLNLMAYYNCWCGEYSDKIRIKFDSTFKQCSVIDDNSTDDGLKTLLVPIKYNQKYTIFLNANYPVSLATVCMSDNKILTTSVLSKNIIPSCNFSHPYLFQGVKKVEYGDNDRTGNSEKYLTLLIQVSTQLSTNVIILEGDYSNNNLLSYGKFGYNEIGVINRLRKVFYRVKTESDDIDYFDYPDLIDKYCLVSPQLIRNVDDNSYAFDDRLVEYLLLNVIDSNDTIGNNIERTQTDLLSSSNILNNKITTYNTKYKVDESDNSKYISKIIPKISYFGLLRDNYKDYLKGVWDTQLRMYIYDLVTQHWKTPKTVDISGYVDKDVETIIGDNV